MKFIELSEVLPEKNERVSIDFFNGNDECENLEIMTLEEALDKYASRSVHVMHKSSVCVSENVQYSITLKG